MYRCKFHIRGEDAWISKSRLHIVRIFVLLNSWFCGNLGKRDLNLCNIFINLVSKQGQPMVYSGRYLCGRSLVFIGKMSSLNFVTLEKWFLSEWDKYVLKNAK